MIPDKEPGSSPSHALVVDGDPLVQAQVRDILEGIGLRVAVAARATEARALLASRPFDLVIADLLLEDAPGMGLLGHVKSVAPDVPVVVLISGTDVRHVTEAVREGAFDFLRKPITAVLLVDTIRRALAVARGQARAAATVLVVEDDPVHRRIVSASLEDAGHEVRSVDALPAARAILESQRVDLLVTDIVLAGESGLDLLAEIRRRDRELPVVIITALTDAKVVIEGLRGGAFEYLVKPYPREALLDAVRRGLEQRALVEEARAAGRKREEYERRLEKLGADLESLVLERTHDLRLMHEFTESILRSIASGIVTVDLECRVTSANASARRILELAQDGGVGQPLDQTPALAPFAPAVGRALKAGKPLNREELRLALDPDRTLLVGYGVSLLTAPEAGRLQGAILHFADITNQRAFEDALMQSDKLASLGQMASAMAHDVNGPLTAVLGFAEMLRSRLTLDPVGLAHLDKVLAGVHHCEAVIANLLKFSRNERYQVEPTDLGDVVRSVIDLVTRELGRRSIKIEANIPAGLPLCAGNAAELRQLFFNLFLNARDAMPSGGAVTVTIEPEGGRLTARVADTGQGMTPEVMRAVFRPFFTTKPAGRGTGLGLAICAAIVSRHGGQIGVESAPGHGTAFTIHLPLAGAPVPAPSAPMLPAPLSKRLRILVVDDDEGVRQLCQAVIEEQACIAIAVASAEDGLEMLSTTVLDAILADVNLPGMDGMTFCVQVRARYPDLPVALMSGSVNIDRDLLCERWGALDLLRKPFGRDALARVLLLLAARQRPAQNP